MKAILDPDGALDRGLAAIRSEFQVPAGFPPPVLADAQAAAARVPTAHVDRTDVRFITLDPAGSTDLDQAFAIEAAGTDLLLRYAIADVAFFVDEDSAMDHEAWARGETLYLPDGKASLYPEVVSQGAASLLPDVERPAVVFAVRLDPDGEARLDGAERAVIRSAAKLAYETATDADLPPLFGDFAARAMAAETRRGASRIDPPEQEVAANTDGGFTLAFRPRRPAEDRNATLSLACNLAVAAMLQAHGTGLFRVMAQPDAHAVARLRHSAAALGLSWAADAPLDAWERGLDAADPRAAAMMTAIRRAGGGASYQPYRAGVTPWHSAVAATYAHATAPLRRLADQYVVQAALAVANGQPVPDAVQAAFERLPLPMARADAIGGRIDRAVVDLAEAVMLEGREGETFAAMATDIDDHHARIQLTDLPIVARVAGQGIAPGARLQVRLIRADALTRTLAFEMAS